MGRIIIKERMPGQPTMRTFKIVHQNPMTYASSEDIVIKAGDPPHMCPVCFTEGSVVNYCEEGFHFRCTVPECGYKW